MLSIEFKLLIFDSARDFSRGNLELEQRKTVSTVCRIEEKGIKFPEFWFLNLDCLSRKIFQGHLVPVF